MVRVGDADSDEGVAAALDGDFADDDGEDVGDGGEENDDVADTWVELFLCDFDA